MILFEYVNRVIAWHQSRDRGATAVEYVLVLAAVIGVIGLAIFAIGTRTDGLLDRACQQLGMGTTC